MTGGQIRSNQTVRDFFFSCSTTASFCLVFLSTGESDLGCDYWRGPLFSLIDMNRLEVCVAAAGRFDVSGREKMRGERDDHFGPREREKKS